MDTLQDLLTDGTRYSPRYRPSMNSDHLPMTLCAINGLGGDFATCVAYRIDYKTRLHEVAAKEPIRDWRRGMGQHELYPSLFAYFRNEVAKNGIESTVGDYLPQLIGSLALEAFHAIIRLGYAIDFDSEAETAAALAYMVSSHREIPFKVDSKIDLERALLSQASAGPRSFESSGFSKSICELVDTGEYPVGCAGDIGDCAAVALDIYRSTRNFFALHMVTATQAVRICSQYVDEKLALAALTGGLLAAHRVVGSPGFERSNPTRLNVRIDGEHAYKYVWACLSEYLHYGDERYAEEIRESRGKELVPTWCATSIV